MKIDVLKTLVTEVPLLVPEAIWLNNNIDLEKVLEGNDNTDVKRTSTILLNHLTTNFDKKDMTLEDELYLYSIQHHLKETMEFLNLVLNKKGYQTKTVDVTSDSSTIIYLDKN